MAPKISKKDIDAEEFDAVATDVHAKVTEKDGPAHVNIWSTRHGVNPDDPALECETTLLTDKTGFTKSTVCELPSKDSPKPAANEDAKSKDKADGA